MPTARCALPRPWPSLTCAAGHLCLGGVWDCGAKNWQMLFSGSISSARCTAARSARRRSSPTINWRTAKTDDLGRRGGTPLPWADPANWQGGNVGENGEFGSDQQQRRHRGALRRPDAQSSALAAGGLTISGGAKLTPVRRPRRLGGQCGVCPDGRQRPSSRLGSGAINLNMGVRGGDATATVGGSGDPAVIDGPRPDRGLQCRQCRQSDSG